MEKKAIKDKRLLKALLTFKLWKEEAKVPYAFDAWGPWTRKGKKKKKNRILGLWFEIFFLLSIYGYPNRVKKPAPQLFCWRANKKSQLSAQIPTISDN